MARTPEQRRKSKMQFYGHRRKKIFEYLGGKCVVCGSTENLQVDHVDHNNKTFPILQNYSIAWDFLVEEMKKCQVLCKKHHLEKSIQEGSLAKGWTNQPQWKHGTLKMYQKKKCRCELCLEARARANELERQRYRRKKLQELA